jgi:tetratricopeptide (TPR) repeat protein
VGAQGFVKQLDLDEQLLNGIAAAREGRRAEARAILMDVVEREERNEQAWLWLAGVMDDPADVRVCLENVLELNPANARARQGLDWLNARYAPPAPEAPRADDPPPTADDGRPVDHTAQETAASGRQSAGYTTETPAPGTREPARTPQPPTLPVEAAGAPCPYCGAPTSARQRSCTQCRQSLMIQTDPPDRPSRWLGALAGALRAAGALVVAGGLAYVVAALLAYQAARFGGPGGQEVGDAPLPLRLITIGVALLVAGANIAALAGPLRRRSMAAYFAVVVGLPLALALAAFGLLRGLPAQTLDSVPADAAAVIAGGLGAALLALLALLALCAALTGMAYRDFFGPMVRFVPVLEPADATTHYNSGVAYRKRGMWYMAAREWERAVAQAPSDINYLRALGLAYTQLGRFDPAREMIGRALRLAPDHAGLREDQALVEQQAARAARV